MLFCTTKQADISGSKTTMSRICFHPCRGSAEVTRQAHNLITALVKDPDKELDQILPKLKLKMPASASSSSAASASSSAAASAVTNTATFTATMWHNSMANNIPPGTVLLASVLIQPNIAQKHL